MGNDISVILSDEASTFAVPPDCDQVYISGYSRHVSVLLLACFRCHDLRDHADYYNDRPEDVYHFPIHQYVCSLERALYQLEQGMAVLRRTFSDLAGLDALGIDLANLLRRHDRKYLHMELIHCSGNEAFDLMMQHCILGFDYPACKMYYDAQQAQRWPLWYLPPAPSGIMDWAGALRRISLLAAVDPSELSEAQTACYDAADGSLLLPWNDLTTLAYIM